MFRAVLRDMYILYVKKNLRRSLSQDCIGVFSGSSPGPNKLIEPVISVNIYDIYSTNDTVIVLVHVWLLNEWNKICLLLLYVKLTGLMLPCLSTQCSIVEVLFVSKSIIVMW